MRTQASTNWRAALLAGLALAAAPALGQESAPPDAGTPAAEEQPATEQPAAEQEQTAGEPAAADQPAADQAPPETVPAVPVAAEPETPMDPDAVELDTIQVTASKRLKSQRDLPGSVGAIRGLDLEQMRAQGMSDFLKLIPGVSLADYGTGQQIPVIRGIASAVDNPGVQFTGLTTGLFLDDMPFNDLFIPLAVPDLNPFDLERVEVLKGPQGTLFGASALAGAIRYISQKPNLDVWQGKLSSTVVQTEFSENSSTVHAGALNVPVGSVAALRLVGLFRDEAGMYDSNANGSNSREEDDIDHFEQKTGRALGRWDVTDELKVSALYFRQNTDQNDVVGAANQPERPERNDVPHASPFEYDFSGANLSATYDFPVGQLLYSGNMLDKNTYTKAGLERALPQQLGNQEDAAWYALLIGGIKGVVHELRFSSPEGGDDSAWEWIAGASFMNFVQDFFQFTPNPGPADEGYYANPPDRPEDVAPQDRVNSFLWATVDADGTEKSAFGEATRRLGDHWEATAGVRVFNTEVIANTVFSGAQIVALGEPGQTETRAHFEARESGVNPKFALRYMHDRNMQVYLLAAKGFQFGGFQLNPPIADIENAAEAKGYHFGPYKSSDLWDYEIGVRTEWLDRRLRFDVTAFYLDWKNLQLTIQVPVNAVPIPAPPGSGVPEDVPLDVIVNVARAHSEGLEAALEVAPFAGATFTSSAAWISALTDEPFDVENDAGPVEPGTRLPGTPRFQWANVLAYENSLPYFSGWTGGFALTHSHIGSSPNDLRPVMTVGGYDTLDARVNLMRQGTAWLPEISFGVNNLTDVRGIAAYAGDVSVTNAYFFVRPRTTLLTLAWKY